MTVDPINVNAVVGEIMNNVKVFVLLAGMTAVMGMVGKAMGGQGGMLIALLLAGAMNFYMYFN